MDEQEGASGVNVDRMISSVRLAAMLQDDIAQGIYGLGAAIPSEAEMRERFGVGRHTVREAVRRLVDAGLVERRQGAPTRVVAQQPRATYVHSVHSLSELFQFTRETQLEIADKAIVPLEDEEAALVGAAPGSRWLRFRGIRREVGQHDVISHTTVLFHARFAPLVADATKPTGPLYLVIEKGSGELVTEARQEISAGPLPADAARALGLQAGTFGIMVARRYFDMSGSTMMASRNWHSAEAFRYAITLRRES